MFRNVFHLNVEKAFNRLSEEAEVWKGDENSVLKTQYSKAFPFPILFRNWQGLEIMLSSGLLFCIR